MTLLGAASVAQAATQSLQIQASPNAQATVPETITATGQVGVPSTIAIYAQPSGVCAGTAAGEPALGATLVDQRTIPGGPFSFSAAFTPAAAGTYAICTYLDGSANGMTEHQNQQSSLAVAAAPPRPAAPAAPPVTATPPVTAAPLVTRICLVPSLRRHTLRGAVHFLALANCKLGVVYRPSAAALRLARRRAGGRTPTLVVVSQTPAAGSVRAGGYTVAVRLGFGRPPRVNPTRPTP